MKKTPKKSEARRLLPGLLINVRCVCVCVCGVVHIWFFWSGTTECFVYTCVWSIYVFTLVLFSLCNCLFWNIFFFERVLLLSVEGWFVCFVYMLGLMEWCNRFFLFIHVFLISLLIYLLLFSCVIVCFWMILVGVLLLFSCHFFFDLCVLFIFLH